MIKNKEHLRIAKLRKMLAFSLVCLFFSLYWVRMKYIDQEFTHYHIESLQQEIIDLENDNNKSDFVIDSLSKTKDLRINKIKSKILINTKQLEKTKDSTLSKIVENTSDIIFKEPADTLNR